MPDPAPDRRNPWIRIFWIVLAIVVGVTIIGVLILETLAPGVVVVSR